MRVFWRFWPKRLLFLVLLTCFAVSNDMDMRTEKKFEHLCSRLLDMGRLELATVDFGELCESVGAGECKMSNLMYAHYGLSPEEVLLRLCAASDKTYGNN